MSYCRWSSDNWKCDLYCYEGVNHEWFTHVAGSRRVGVENLPPDPLTFIGEVTSEVWKQRYDEHRKALESLPFEDITLPYAGETFYDGDLESFKARLLSLRELGYSFPDYVLDQINAELGVFS